MSNRSEALQEIVDIAARHQLQADEVISALNKTPLADQAERSTGILAKITAYLGGVFVLAGIAIFIGMQWDQFSSAVRVLLTLGTGFAVYLFALTTMTDARFSKVTTPMLLIAALVQPTGIVVMLNEYSHGVRAHGRHIETQILVGLGDFHHRGTAHAQPAPAANGFIRTFNGLYSEYRRVAHHHCLPDIQATDGFGKGPTKSNITSLLGCRRHLTQLAFLRQFNQANLKLLQG